MSKEAAADSFQQSVTDAVIHPVSPGFRTTASEKVPSALIVTVLPSISEQVLQLKVTVLPAVQGPETMPVNTQTPCVVWLAFNLIVGPGSDTHTLAEFEFRPHTSCTVAVILPRAVAVRSVENDPSGLVMTVPFATPEKVTV